MENNSYPIKLRETTELLAEEINKCIDKLINARVSQDRKSEEEALQCMESLMISSLQQLQCISDFLKSRNFG